VLFIGTQFSILYTSMYSPAEADVKVCEDAVQQDHANNLHDHGKTAVQPEDAEDAEDDEDAEEVEDAEDTEDEEDAEDAEDVEDAEDEDEEDADSTLSVDGADGRLFYDEQEFENLLAET
jgi:hypothetical protein